MLRANSETFQGNQVSILQVRAAAGRLGALTSLCSFQELALQTFLWLGREGSARVRAEPTAYTQESCQAGRQGFKHIAAEKAVSASFPADSADFTVCCFRF